MKFFERKIGTNGALAKYYFQEPNHEIDINRKYPTIVVCPGGAFMWTSFREDEPIALRFLAEGFHVVVVHYATEGIAAYNVENANDLPAKPVSVFPNPITEVAQAIAYLRENATEYAVDPDHITVMGFSAGGTVAAQLGVFWQESWLSEKVQKPNKLFKPNSLMLGYAALDLTLKSTRPLPASMRKKTSHKLDNTMLYAALGKLKPTRSEVEAVNPLNHVTGAVPPTFMWHTQEDPLVPVLNSIEFAAELERHLVPTELHVFTHGKHGLALGDYRSGVKKDQTSAAVYTWVDSFLEWVSPNKTTRRSFYTGI